MNIQNFSLACDHQKNTVFLSSHSSWSRRTSHDLGIGINIRNADVLQPFPSLIIFFYSSGMALSDDASQDPERFGDLFERLVDDLTEDDASNPEIKDAALRFKEVRGIFLKCCHSTATHESVALRFVRLQ